MEATIGLQRIVCRESDAAEQIALDMCLTPNQSNATERPNDSFPSLFN